MTSLVLDQLGTYGPDHCEQVNLPEAVAYTRSLAEAQYENFTVVSWLLPTHLREEFYAIYSFCRWADDLGDEVGDPQRSLELLAWWRTELDACYEGKPRHPVFVALQPVIEKHDIPRKPFDDLIDAFVQDQTVTRYASWDDVVDYCTRSANPVGRLVLYVCGYRDEERQRLSDATCTALQLANFWQDVKRDILERDRIYIPSRIASDHGLDLEFLSRVLRMDHEHAHGHDHSHDHHHHGHDHHHHDHEGDACAAPGAAEGGKSEKCCSCHGEGMSIGVSAMMPMYRRTIMDLTRRTWPLFEEGRQLWPLLDKNVRGDVQLFTLGCEAILKKIRSHGYDTLTKRPKLGKGAKASLMMRVAAGRMIGWGGRRGSTSPTPATAGAADAQGDGR